MTHSPVNRLKTTDFEVFFAADAEPKSGLALALKS